MSKYKKWNGGACPVPKGTLVDVIFRDGGQSLDIKEGLDRTKQDSTYVFGTGVAEDWSHDDVDGDIVEYRLSAVN